MAAKKETAEQKLLKMIEDSGGAEASATKTKQKVDKKQSLLSVVKSVNNILFIALLASVAFLINEVRTGTVLLSKSVQFSIKQVRSNRSLGVESLIPTVQRLSFYLSSVNRRNIFKPYEAKVVADVSDKNRQIANKIANFKLVGVSWLDRIETASVMIEDTEKSVTYFLQKGEKIGDIVVKTIYADSAVLGYENEEIEIRYDKSQM